MLIMTCDWTLWIRVVERKSIYQWKYNNELKRIVKKSNDHKQYEIQEHSNKWNIPQLYLEENMQEKFTNSLRYWYKMARHQIQKTHVKTVILSCILTNKMLIYCNDKNMIFQNTIKLKVYAEMAKV